MGNQRVNALAQYFVLATVKQNLAANPQREDQRERIVASLGEGQRLATSLERQFGKPEQPAHPACEDLRDCMRPQPQARGLRLRLAESYSLLEDLAAAGRLTGEVQGLSEPTSSSAC